MKKFFFLLFCTANIITGCIAQDKNATAQKPVSRPANLSDTALLELVQKQTFHSISGILVSRW